MIKEHPLLFTGDMVRAILDDRKTQTRRIGARYKKWKVGELIWVRETWWDLGHTENGIWEGRRESHTVKPKYAATCPDPFAEGIGGVVEPKKCHWKKALLFNSTWRKRSSIHMPKWAARIWLEITGIREEFLQDITEEDAKAEGIKGYDAHGGGTHFNPVTIYPAFPEKGGGFRTAREAFELLWDSINAKRDYGWDTNPKPVVITFKRIGNEH